eukprot:gene54462-34112_t
MSAYFGRFLSPVADSGLPLRSLFGCVPLRTEDAADDSAAFQIRHKTIAQWLAAEWFIAVVAADVGGGGDAVTAERDALPTCPPCLAGDRLRNAAGRDLTWFRGSGSEREQGWLKP